MKRAFVKIIFRIFLGWGIVFAFFSSSLSADIHGIYSIPEGANLELKQNRYQAWFEENGNKATLQIGTYTIEGETIIFHPSYDALKNLSGIASGKEDAHMDIATVKIIDDCTIEWGGDTFRKRACDSLSESSKNIKDGEEAFPDSDSDGYADEASPTPQKKASTKHPWKVVRKGAFELSAPEGAKVYADREGIEIDYAGGNAGIEFITEDNKDFFLDIVEDCDPVKKFSKGELRIFQCSEKSHNRYLMLLKRDLKKYRFVYYVAADTPKILKNLSLAVASIRIVPKKAMVHTANSAYRTPPMYPWHPSDNSFSIDVPQGWAADGGTADLGRNGYLRIVHVFSPDRREGFIGVYYPFYQYIQMGSTQSGYAPMDGKSYIYRRFFSDLARYGINFNQLNLEDVNIDLQASQEATMEARQLLRQTDSTTDFQYQIVWGKGVFFATTSQPLELLLFGYMQYVRKYQAYGVMTSQWGPAPFYITYAPKEEMGRWFHTFEKIGKSWQVNPQWFQAHFNYARQDAQKSIGHFRKISNIIRQHEKSLDAAMQAHDAQNHVEDELFWDRFYALGGEDRLNNPNTGEEIDLPTGADKYLYDEYSQSWVGINQDQPDAEEWTRHLKENGWVELKPHQW